jgi:hypothetical protein
MYVNIITNIWHVLKHVKKIYKEYFNIIIWRNEFYYLTGLNFFYKIIANKYITLLLFLYNIKIYLSILLTVFILHNFPLSKIIFTVCSALYFVASMFWIFYRRKREDVKRKLNLYEWSGDDITQGCNASIVYSFSHKTFQVNEEKNTSV